MLRYQMRLRGRCLSCLIVPSFLVRDGSRLAIMNPLRLLFNRLDSHGLLGSGAHSSIRLWRASWSVCLRRIFCVGE